MNSSTKSIFVPRRVPSRHSGSIRASRTLRGSLRDYVAPMTARLRDLAPYAAILLIVLPGGTLIALLIWLYQRQKATRSGIPGSRPYSPRIGSRSRPLSPTDVGVVV